MIALAPGRTLREKQKGPEDQHDDDFVLSSLGILRIGNPSKVLGVVLRNAAITDQTRPVNQESRASAFRALGSSTDSYGLLRLG
jgi:hypothetical protein